MSLRVIFFDNTGTLYSSDDFDAAQEFQPILQLSEIKGISIAAAEKLFKETKKRLEETIEPVTKVAVMIELGIARLEMQEYLGRLDAGKYLDEDNRLIEILHGLKEKYPLGIITNVLEKTLINNINALGLPRSLFDYVVTVDNTQNSKPHEEPFLKAIELANVRPEECAYVGDSYTKDMIPAKKVGMKTIWVSSKEESHPEVDARIESVYKVNQGLKKITNIS